MEAIKEFVASRCDIMKAGKLSNMISGIELPDEIADSLLNCFEKGEELYKDYRKTRLVERTKGLFDTFIGYILKRRRF